MKRLTDSFAEYLARAGVGIRRLPEHRELKLYSNSAGYQFLKDDNGIATDLPVTGALNPMMAFILLDTHFESRDPSLEGMSLRQRYLTLPRTTKVDKMTAQIYRLLRLYRIGLVQSDGTVEESQGCIRSWCVANGTAFNLIITKAGLALAESFVSCYLNLLRLPFGEAYREALLSQYYADMVAEVKKFHDEDADLLRFYNRYQFNRHFRFDCGNPKFVVQGDQLVFDIADSYCNPLLYPIDFYVTVDDALHIIPMEALKQNRLPMAGLPGWRQLVIDSNLATAQQEIKFGHESVSNGGPMS